MITRKNRVEPTLILQSVNNVTTCKRNKKEKYLFFSFYKVFAVNPTQIESRDQKKSRDKGSSFCNNFGIKRYKDGLKLRQRERKATIQ